ncbi:MAG: hypothetical protein JWN02_525 [Acidobacteria bacterium]|nr:hypothetical protein [Acidobacteriota bacterium]
MPLSAPGEPIASPLGVNTLAAAGNGGDVSLVVWSAPSALFAARVGPAGMLDPFGILLDPSGSVGAPVVAATDDGFVMAWNVIELSRSAVRVRFIGRDGSRGPIQEGGAPYDCRPAQIAANGSRVLIVSGFCDEYVGTLTDARGNVLSRDIPIGNKPEGTIVAADSAGFVVYATKRVPDPQRDDLYARRIDANGVTSPWFLAAHLDHPVISLAAAAEGTTELVTYSDADGLHLLTGLAGSSNIMTGGALLATGIIVQQALVSQGGRTWMAWERDSGELLAGALANGTIDTPRAIVSPGDAPALALTSRGVLAVWTTPAVGGVKQALARFLEPVPDTPFLVSRATAAQGQPSTAGFADTRLTAWLEYTNGSPRVVAGTGTGKGAGPTITVSSPGALIPAVELFTSTGVAVGAGTGDFLVVWQERESGGSSRLMARRIGADLLPEDAQPFELVHSLSNLGRSAIAFDGSQWLVVYPYATDHGYVGVRGIRVSRQGTLVDAAPLQISSHALQEDNARPQVVWYGGHFVVAWVTSFSYGVHMPIRSSIATGSVAGDGSVSLGQELIPPAVDPSGTFGLSDIIQSFRLVAGAHSLLLLWREANVRIGSSGFERVRISRSLLDASPSSLVLPSRSRIASQPSLQTFASDISTAYDVVFDGTRYHFLHQQDGSTLLEDTSIGEDGAVGATSSVDLGQIAVIDTAIGVPGGAEVLLHAHTSGPPFGPTQRLFWLSTP